MTAAMRGADLVFHFAANADVRFGTEHPRRDLEQNTIATYNVLEAMRAAGVSRIALLVDGLRLRRGRGHPDAGRRAVPGPDVALRRVEARRRGADRRVRRRLRLQRLHLPIRLDPRRALHATATSSTSTSPCAAIRRGCASSATGGSASRYLYIQDCVERDRRGRSRRRRPACRCSISGTDEYCEVNDSIGWICEHLGVRPALEYTGGDRGWIGDNPFIFLDCAKVRALGWRPALSIREGVLRTLQYLQNSPELLEARS